MKRFDFPLDRLLKVKRQLERLAEMEQLRCTQLLDQSRKKVLAIQQQLQDASDAISARIGNSFDPRQWASIAEYSEGLTRAIVVAEREVSVAENQLALAAQELIQIATEVEALKTLREQQWEKWKAEFQKADQERLDELGLRRWMQARAKAELAHSEAA